MTIALWNIFHGLVNVLCFCPGPFVRGLEYASGTTAEVVGKPERAFFTAAIEDLHVGCDECLMIGDVNILA